MPEFLFPKSLRVTTKIYQEVLRNIVRPWMDRVNKHPTSSSRTPPPSTRPRGSSRGCLKMFTPLVAGLVPFSSPDFNPLDYFFWGLIKDKTHNHAKNTVDSLEASIVEELAAVDKTMFTSHAAHFAPALTCSSELAVLTLKNNVVCIINCS